MSFSLCLSGVPQLASNSRSSYLILLIAGVTGVHRYTLFTAAVFWITVERSIVLRLPRAPGQNGIPLGKAYLATPWLESFPFLFLLFFSETEFLCSFGACPGISPVDQASLELTEIRLPLPPKC